jgi:hypothetical protein
MTGEETRFNVPPGWPVPQGWSPPPDWQPDPAWPPAPPGWVFWTDAPARADERADQAADPPAVVSWLSRRWKLVTALVVAMAVAAVVAAVLTVVLPRVGGPTSIRTLPYTGPTIRPDWPGPAALYVDFRTWTAFGGIDAQFGSDGTSVTLDTHDTTDTWRTKWSGLIQPGPTRCDLRMTGRVRDISHAQGVPGGFGIGLATVTPGDPASAQLDGTAIQFDYGQQGFRTALYPSDGDSGLQPGSLDHGWHDIEITIDAHTHTLSVDGHRASSVPTGGRCGNPVIRIWAGSAEFADFSFVSG